MHKTITTLLGLTLTAAAHGMTNEITLLSDVEVQTRSQNSRLPEFSTSTTVLDATMLEGGETPHLQDVLGMVPNLNAAGGPTKDWIRVT